MIEALPKIDFAPAAQQVSVLAAAVRDDQLEGPTPCTNYTVRDLLDHFLGLTLAFRAAADKAPPDDGPAQQRPSRSPAALPADWRERLTRQLDALVAAWRVPAAWGGEATVGGVTLPAAQMGVVALDELVLHGWDLARATGQPFGCEPVHVEAVLGFTTAVAEAGPEAREGLFGPLVDVPPDAPAFDRALGLAGRDPAWTS